MMPRERTGARLDSTHLQTECGRRDALTARRPAKLPPGAAASECPICFEDFKQDESGNLVPRILTDCGHTACQECITDMLDRVDVVGDSKALDCPSCHEVTQMLAGDASNLKKNYPLL